MSSDSSLDRALHAIADPTRRRILLVLKESAGKTPAPKHIHSSCQCGGDIEEHIHLSQPTISHHMAVLKNAGLVESEKIGQWMWYRRNEVALREFAKALRKDL